MKTIEIKVPQDIVTYLERLAYDVETRERIVSRLIETHKDDKDDTMLTSNVFTSYHKELAEKQAEYELAKQEMVSIYMPKDLQLGYNWNLDFKERTLSIVVGDDYELKADESEVESEVSEVSDESEASQE